MSKSLDEALGVGEEGHCISCGVPLETPAEPTRTPCDHISPLTGKKTVMANGECYLCHMDRWEREGYRCRCGLPEDHEGPHSQSDRGTEP